MQGGIFMANKRNKKSWREEEKKWSNKILIGMILPMIIVIGMGMPVMVNEIRKNINPITKGKIISLVILAVLFLLLVYVGCWAVWNFIWLFRKYFKDEIKKHEELKSRLSKDNFTEVYIAESDLEKDQKKMILTILEELGYNKVYSMSKDEKIRTESIKPILKEAGCKFYAKLNKEDEIIVIAKDSNDKVLYNDEIKNSLYFDATFKFSED